jgi:hypothetical protein
LDGAVSVVELTLRQIRWDNDIAVIGMQIKTYNFKRQKQVLQESMSVDDLTMPSWP